MENIILVENLRVVYKPSGGMTKSALKDVSFRVRPGEIFGFLGPNGAGKTTAIKVILGLVRPAQGRVEVLGRPCGDIKSHYQLGYMPEIAYYYQYLTPQELLFMYGRLLKLSKNTIKERTDYLLDIVGLIDSRNILMKTFSKGMMQKVSLAQALLNEPELLVLDEPTSGLDPIARMKVRDIIRDLKSKNKTIFFSSHELSEVETVSDNIGILHEGNLLKIGKLNEVLNERGQHESLEKYFLRIIQKEICLNL
ncbi:MAG: ABC transporter ATP-binding protein [Candidatus Omnitrophota bacterium]